MSDRSAVHATFVLERDYRETPQRVFEAWSSEQAKTQWFGPPDTAGEDYRMDFRIGGEEHLRVPTTGGGVYTYIATYQDIVPGERIVYTYEMYRDEDRISVSVATMELLAREAGTGLRLTEQGVFLDGHDTPQEREDGTRGLLEALARALGEGEGA
jgi:uncharacterized protein YndB with AHSA1/START domain